MSPSGNVRERRGSSNLITSELLQLFTCCALHPNSSNSSHQKGTRARLDISMISGPSDFRHMAHLGSDEVHSGHCSFPQLQHQMGSKGG